MRQKMKHLMGILLSLVLILGMMPGMSLTAYAATETYTKLKNDKTVVKFNNHDWYIIADDSTATGGTVTMLAADTSFGTSAFDSSGQSNSYNNSDVKRYLDSIVAGTAGEGKPNFAGVADAIQPVTLTTYKYNSTTEVAETTENAKLYLLSTSEAKPYKSFYFTGAQYGDWWLRSPGGSGGNYAVYVDGEDDHIDGNGDNVVAEFGVRPALKLNLSSVIFSSESNTFTLKPSHTHNNINFTEWTDELAAEQNKEADKTASNSLPTTSGSYYLTKDVTLNGAWIIENDINLCLNGHSITYSGEEGNTDYVIKINSGTLSLYDEAANSGKITGGTDGGVYVNDSGTFNMYGGTITGNTGEGGVNTAGTFNMYGGKISGNCASKGGGVQIQGDAGSIFNMSGNASITGNKASESGGGVYVQGGYSGGDIPNKSGKLNISGSVVIKDNTVKADTSANSNVFLEKDHNNTSHNPAYDAKITITGGLTDSACIGVTMEEPGVFTSDWGTYMSGKTASDFFISDNTDYGVQEIKNGENTELMIGSHTHSFTYSTSGTTITATCANTDGKCTLPLSSEGGTDHIAKLTIKKPTLETYGQTGEGISEKATLDGSEAFNSATGLTVSADSIKYYKATKSGSSYSKGDEITTGAPANAGNYMAEITLTGVKTSEGEGKSVTASVGYTIAKADPTANAPTGLTATYGQTLADVSLVNKNPTGNTAGSWEWAVATTTSVGNVGDNKFKADFTPTDSNNYNSKSNVEVTVAVSKAAAHVIADVTDTLLYTTTSVSESVAGKMPEDAGTLTYMAGTATKTGSVTVSNFAVGETNGVVTATLSGGAAGDTITLPVTISSTNYADSTVNVVITLTAKADADVSITGAPTSAKTYGDADFTLTGSVTNPGTGTGVWTWESSDGTVLEVTANGSTATVKILKAGSATVTATYESDTTLGSKAPDAITVNTKTLTIEAKDQTIYVGDPVPNLVGADFYTVTGLVGTDSLTTAPTLTYQKNGAAATPDNTTPGNYDIVPSGASAGDNYYNTF